jgi:hypothetical protein
MSNGVMSVVFLPSLLLAGSLLPARGSGHTLKQAYGFIMLNRTHLCLGGQIYLMLDLCFHDLIFCHPRQFHNL